MTPTNIQCRRISKYVIRWFLELEGGCVRIPVYGDIFDIGFVDFRLDVERLMKEKLAWHERNVLLLIGRDGITAREACEIAGVPGAHSPMFRPDSYVQRLEAKFGRLCIDNQLADVLSYATKLS